MEMGSSSSTESLNGLKFGHKIYFEDSSSAAPPSTASRPSGSAGKKVRSSSVQAGQPPRCQVEGCKVDLSDAKAYYSRHKVCGMHSKHPKVVVAGIEQRFCQQCSRFHQLSEFDQGKRSCRRRLAGHNERRRKPPPGSLLSSRYESGSRVGSFLMDFSAYPRLGRDACLTGRTSERFLPYPWQSNNSSENPPMSNLFLPTSACGTSITAGHIIPPPPPPPVVGECISVVSADSSCALSLLSNQQPWGSSRTRSPSSFGLQSLMSNNNNAHGAPPLAEPTTAAPHGGTVNHFLAASWGVKGHDNMAENSSHQNIPGLGLGQITQPLTGQFSGELELSHQSRRPYMEPENARDFDDSCQHMHWSL